jgi:hypothetical protein
MSSGTDNDETQKLRIDIGAHLLPGLPVEEIRACYARAAGNEIDSGKFASSESSAALAANAFGFYLLRPETLPALPGTEDLGWPASALTLEGVVRFPWSGGRHPCLDVLIETQTALIGIESKRYEPFRSKGDVALSDAYDRAVWGSKMSGFTRVRDDLRTGVLSFHHLDAAQLVKHAFGLRTAVQEPSKHTNRRPILFYLFAEPKARSDGRLIAAFDVQRHRDELQQFADLVQGNEVDFRWATYKTLLDAWAGHEISATSGHAQALLARFDL